MKKFLGLTALAASLVTASPVYAGAVISNGTISLGVGDQGQLNFGGVGVKDLRTGFDGTVSGCLCEGWGVADAGTGTNGHASFDTPNNGGIVNVAVGSFTSTASTATSVVNVAGASSMQVTHAFGLSASNDLYQIDVTIKNTGASAITDLRYRRLMDWDIQPTAFSEFVTVGGVGASNLIYSSDNGFANANPLVAGSFISAGTVNTNFVDSGTADHGALFDFGFGALGAGESKTFKIFYGGSLTEAGAFSALSAVGAEVYSLGQSSDNKDGTKAGRTTFAWGFAGVGGTVVGGAVPEPATWAMMIGGFGAIGGSLRNRRRKTSVAFA